MTNINWNIEKLSTLLGRLFLRKMLANLRGYADATVQIGEMGVGVKPNYQVRFPNGQAVTFRGSTHRRFTQRAEFEPDHLSSPFSESEVREALKIAVDEATP